MVFIFEISRTNLMPVLKMKVAVVCVLWFEGDRQSYTFHYRSACSMAAYVCINRDRHVHRFIRKYLPLKSAGQVLTVYTYVTSILKVCFSGIVCARNRSKNKRAYSKPQ